MSEAKRMGWLKPVLELSRIGEWWLIATGLILFAFIPNIYRANGDAIAFSDVWRLGATPPLYVSLVVVFCAQVFLFAANDYHDRHVDAMDEVKGKRNPVSAGRVSENSAVSLLVVSLMGALVASAYFGLLTFIFTAGALFVFYFYTAEPLRFKRRAGLDVVSHALLINTFPFFFVLVALFDFSSGALFVLIVLMVRSAMAQLLQEVRDYELDKKVERNSVIALGQKRAVNLVTCLYAGLFAGTVILLTTEQLFGFGVSMFYSFVLFLCVAYLPIIVKLRRAKDYKEYIETLWMGQGKTRVRTGVMYFSSFGLYFGAVFFFLL